MNQDVLDMISRLHARLDDVTAVVNQCDMELEGYAKRLDKIDDQIYLVQVELEKRLKLAHPETVSDNSASSEDFAGAVTTGAGMAGAGAADTDQVEALHGDSAHTGDSNDCKGDSLATEGASEKSKGDSDTKRQIITDDMKENFGEATRALGAIYRDGREAISELTDAMSDIKGTFDIKGKGSRRRR